MATSQEVASVFTEMANRFQPEKAGDTNTVIQFDLSGDNGGSYWLKVADGKAETGQGTADDPSMTLKASADDWMSIVNGDLNPMQAFMTGKVKVQGDMGLAMKMQSMFGM